ncbi:MAG: flavodoxin family protein, partial [Clostridium sp.]
MKLVIHDLKNEEFQKLFPKGIKDAKVISNDGTIKNCIGCFGCWIKTPGVCVIRDNYGDMGEIFSKCDEITIISECCYGGYSPFVKNVLDRAISYVHPNLVMRKGEMHHKRRYDNKFTMNI